MKESEPANPYNEEYFHKHCGPIPYDRSHPEWLKFFSSVADWIVRTINPGTVMDLGCAKGFLVEALRDRGVEAYGIDISSYAISQVRDDLKSFCKVVPVTDPLAESYDLIICIEVLEHVTEREVRIAIQNISKSTADVLFSSTPNDFDEPTHVNVRPVLYWLELFYEAGFYPDLTVDVSFVTPQAILFRKRLPHLREELLPFYAQLIDKRFQLIALQQALAERESEARQLTADRERLTQEKTQVQLAAEAQRQALAEIEERLDMIYTSLGWKLLDGYRQIKGRFLPLHTRRRRTYDLIIKAIKIIGSDGFRVLIAGLLNKFRRRGTTGILIIETDMLAAQSHRVLPVGPDLFLKFNPSIDGLSEIQILTATYMRQNSDLILQMHLDSIDGPVIRTARKSGGDIKDSGYTSFKFRPVKNSGGKTLFLQLRSLGAPSAAVWFNPGVSLPELQLLGADKEILTGSINFKAFAECKVDDPYQLWIIKNEPKPWELEECRRRADNFGYKPKISIVTPVYNPDRNVLIEMIESVRSQVYQNWELVLVDGASTLSHVKKVLEDSAKEDNRIKVKFLDRNYGIGGNSQEALSLTTGEFVGFLDHDDTLAPFALYEVAKILNQEPDVDFVYSDEDKITEQGKRYDPFFKPDWSPDYFLSCNYLCHLSVIRAGFVKEIGGFRLGVEGSQDYDLFLRATERSRKIFHIPKVLYHWRAGATSAAGSTSAKPYAYAAAQRAIGEAISRRGIKASVDHIPPGFYRVKYELVGRPKISIIISTKDQVGILRKCIEAVLAKTRYDNFEIIIVDNQSGEHGILDFYRELTEANKRVRVLEYNKPFNFSAINNYAVANLNTDFCLFLNNDTEVISQEWLTAMLELAQRKNVGAVGAKLYYFDNTVQHAGVVIGLGGIAGHPHRFSPRSSPGYMGRLSVIQDVSAVTAACMMVRQEVFREIGGFDEALAVAFNDVDFCLRLRERGYLVVYTPYAELYHYESKSRGSDDTPERRERFSKEIELMRTRWKHILDSGDPYYNPNLTLDRGDLSLKI